MMKLIKEYNQNIKPLIEQINGQKKYFIKGIFLQSNIKNRNGRIYPKSVLEQEVKRYVKEYIDQNRAYGELGHPDSPSINLDRVSHMIKSLEPDGDNFIGVAKILDTPQGKIVKALINEGASLGVSSRGLGSLSESDDDAQIVQDDFILATAADIVADPSAPDAFVNGIVENAEWVYNASSKSWVLAEKIKKKVMTLSSKQLLEKQLELFELFLDNL